MTTFTVTIKGVSPFLMHRFAEAEEADAQTRAVHRPKEDPRAAAERAAYRTLNGELYLPGTAVARMLREAAGGHKQRGSRKTMKYVLPAAVIVMDDAILLTNVIGESLTDFEVDSRPVVIPATKGRIMRHRPRLNSWWATFTLDVDATIIDPDLVHQILSEGGLRFGVGDFRPEKGGPFGRFHVVRWDEVSTSLAEAAD